MDSNDSMDVRLALAKLESRLSILEFLVLKIDSIETRVRHLENFRSWITGAVAVSGVLGGILGTLLQFLLAR